MFVAGRLYDHQKPQDEKSLRIFHPAAFITTSLFCYKQLGALHPFIFLTLIKNDLIYSYKYFLIIYLQNISTKKNSLKPPPPAGTPPDPKTGMGGERPGFYLFCYKQFGALQPFIFLTLLKMI